jgi:CRISPR-associated protein Csh1
MLGAMRTLALDYLFAKLGGDQSPPDDLETWYRDLRRKSPDKLFRFLVEDSEKIENIYVIRPSGDEKIAELEMQEMRQEISKYLPFIKQPGARDAQVGPIIKRNYSKAKGVSPSRKTLTATVRKFKKNSRVW